MCPLADVHMAGIRLCVFGSFAAVRAWRLTCAALCVFQIRQEILNVNLTPKDIRLIRKKDSGE